MGCDYTSNIRGIGPKSALTLIKKYGDIEHVLENISKGKYQVPPEWLPRIKVRKPSSLPPSAPPSVSPVEEGDKAMPGDENACKTAEVDSKAGMEGEKEEGIKAAAIVAREVAPDEPAKSVEGEVMEVKEEGEG
ncbi:flap endonuclease-1, partial [Nannochloropsis gaditana CCMP526]|uniref:flap endonuclease-1 n=1 Tax=Nannochloropsis gaditana (strain CCMP526) TaxID=1093141 RepID=UPI00029F715F